MYIHKQNAFRTDHLSSDHTLTTSTDHHTQITAADADHEEEDPADHEEDDHADHAEQLPNEVGDIQADQTCQIR